MLDAGVDVAEAKLPVPSEMDDALNPEWLRGALAPISGGAEVVSITIVDKLETVAAKVRFSVRFAGESEDRHFCLKAFLGNNALGGAGATAVREALFFERLAPHLTMRLPQATSVIDLDENRAVLIMEDLIVAGATFCSALDPFTAEQASQSLDQIARLHAASALLDTNPWIPSRLDFIADQPYLSEETLQGLLDDPRSATFKDARTRSAAMLLKGMVALRDRFRGNDLKILHGDCHAGNFYMTKDGPGLTDWQLIQRGVWAQDVAYHIAAVLPVAVAEREEKALVAHYLDAVRKHGGTVPDAERAWEEYRAAQIYGFYHWAITRRVDPAITHVFCERLGAGVERHRTYDLLGL